MTQPIHVLIVDDIRNNITALEASLARPDVSVLKAESGPAALELLLKHEVALAILDVNMPGMDGFELAELMRGSPRTAHVPIIFLTATAQDTGRTFRGYEAGAVDFLYKPFDSRILNSKVDVFIQLERQKQQLATQLSTVQQLLDANEMLMAVLGHDLRTPLSAVIASAEYLSRFVQDENVASIGTRIKSSGMRMVRMVDQLLNLARLRGGRVTLQPRPVELMTLARNIVDEYEARVGKGRIFIFRDGDTLLQGVAARPRWLGDPGAARRKCGRRTRDQRAERGRNPRRRPADDLRAVSLGAFAAGIGRPRARSVHHARDRDDARRQRAGPLDERRRNDLRRHAATRASSAHGTHGAGAAVQAQLRLSAGLLHADCAPCLKCRVKA
jgi:CheY-like chemotaxis protein